MTTDQKIFLLSLFDQVDRILTIEINKLLRLGIEPDIDGNHQDERWIVLKSIQDDKESFQDSHYTVGKDAWSFESKVKIGEKRRDDLLQRLSTYKEDTKSI